MIQFKKEELESTMLSHAVLKSYSKRLFILHKLRFLT